MRRGLVLVFTLWDDHTNKMNWLDSDFGNSTSKGYKRGSCSTDAGDPTNLESNFPNSDVKFSNIKFGPINTTFTPNEKEKV
jgi:cellulose 1,4-beta-cellobiosidase